MNLNYFIAQFAHPFVLYVLFGTLTSYILMKLLFRLSPFQGSRARVYMLYIPLLLPIVAYLVLQTYFAKQCILTVDYKHQTVNMLNDLLCSFGNFVTTYITPLFVLTGVLAVVKAVLSLLACNRLIKRYGFAGPKQFPEVFAKLAVLCNKAGLRVPEVLVTRDSFARSFTFGIRRPVIVISQGLIDNLDGEELEAVLAHELAHIIRSDSLLNWVTVFLRDLMFFTPVMFWLFRDLANEKEHATDDITVALTQKPLPLAGALIKVWRMSPKASWDTLALDNFMPYPHFAAQGTLEGRVTRILQSGSYRDEGLMKILAPALLVVLFSTYLLYFVC